MMKRVSTFLAVTMLSLLPAAGLVGCHEHMTEGEKAHREAAGLEDAAERISRGETNIAEGKAKITKGETIKKQGDDRQGDQLIADGKQQVSLGEEQLSQGRKLREKEKD